MKAYIVNTEECHQTNVGGTVFFSWESAMRELKRKVSEFREQNGITEKDAKRETFKESKGVYTCLDVNYNVNHCATVIYIQELDTEDVGCTVEGLIHKTCFNISCLSQEDLEEKGFDTSKITAAQMEHLAGKLGDDYCEQLFWYSLEILAECNGFPKKPETYYKVSVYSDDGTNIDWQTPTALEGKVFRSEEDARDWLDAHGLGECDVNISEVKYTKDELFDDEIDVIDSEYEPS